MSRCHARFVVHAFLGMFCNRWISLQCYCTAIQRVEAIEFVQAHPGGVLSLLQHSSTTTYVPHFQGDPPPRSPPPSHSPSHPHPVDFYPRQCRSNAFRRGQTRYGGELLRSRGANKGPVGNPPFDDPHGRIKTTKSRSCWDSREYWDGTRGSLCGDQ